MAYDYKAEFPDFDDAASADALLAAGWSDRSWGAEACPSFQNGCAYIMVGFIDKSISEWGDEFDDAKYAAERFQIGRCKSDGEDLGEWENAPTLAEALVIAERFNAEALAA